MFYPTKSRQLINPAAETSIDEKIVHRGIRVSVPSNKRGNKYSDFTFDRIPYMKAGSFVHHLDLVIYRSSSKVNAWLSLVLLKQKDQFSTIATPERMQFYDA